MSDDQWRDCRRDEDDFSEYGSLSSTTPSRPKQNMAEVPAEEPISFGDSDTGTLPHWTEPPTGEVPRFDATGGADAPEHDEELDVWSSFSSEAPV
ncbi:MAG: hypothetical protein R2697_06210 [Ilumatobacteraceae bacterium]